jgi:hypothetical protein
MEVAQRMAALTELNTAKNPSPAVSTSVPPQRRSERRTAAR